MPRLLYYEASALPEDSSPVWTRSFSGTITNREASGGRFEHAGDSNSFDRYTIADLAAMRTAECRIRASYDINNDWSFGIAIEDSAMQGVRIFVNDAVAGLNIVIGGPVQSVSLDTSVFHEYRMVVTHLASGFLQGDFYIDGAFQFSITSTNGGFDRPTQFRWESFSSGVTPPFETTWDYVRCIGGPLSGMKVSPRRIGLDP